MDSKIVAGMLETSLETYNIGLDCTLSIVITYLDFLFTFKTKRYNRCFMFSEYFAWPLKPGEFMNRAFMLDTVPLRRLRLSLLFRSRL